MPSETLVLDQVFRALANPTRREVVERLGRGPATMTELSQPFSMALPSFLQHLQVLESCRLVRSTKKGRVRTFELVPQPLLEAEDWMKEHRRHWETRLDQLDRFLALPEENDNA